MEIGSDWLVHTRGPNAWSELQLEELDLSYWDSNTAEMLLC